LWSEVFYHLDTAEELSLQLPQPGSSRRLARDTERNVEPMWLTGVYRPASRRSPTFGTTMAHCPSLVLSRKAVDRISSEALVGALAAMPDRPWGEANNGRVITQNWLARQLDKFGIEPKTIRTGPKTPKGYTREIFEDAFSRYLPDFQTATPKHPNGINGLNENKTATPSDFVVGSDSTKSLKALDCCGVAVGSPQNGSSHEHFAEQERDSDKPDGNFGEHLPWRDGSDGAKSVESAAKNAGRGAGYDRHPSVSSGSTFQLPNHPRRVMSWPLMPPRAPPEHVLEALRKNKPEIIAILRASIRLAGCRDDAWLALSSMAPGWVILGCPNKTGVPMLTGWRMGAALPRTSDGRRLILSTFRAPAGRVVGDRQVGLAH
jgi:Protein of unknown function (DUF3631)